MTKDKATNSNVIPAVIVNNITEQVRNLCAELVMVLTQNTSPAMLQENIKYFETLAASLNTEAGKYPAVYQYLCDHKAQFILYNPFAVQSCVHLYSTSIILLLKDVDDVNEHSIPIKCMTEDIMRVMVHVTGVELKSNPRIANFYLLNHSIH